MEYKTSKAAEIRTEYILQTDTIYVPTYHERITKTQTLLPKKELDIGLLLAWTLIGVIIGCLISYKILK